jgi:tetrahydrodipicolinate N-succinyltransferase
LIRDVDFGHGVIVHPFTNLYGCRIGDESHIGPFVEIQAGAVIGARCKIQSHSFICTGVEIAARGRPTTMAASRAQGTGRSRGRLSKSGCLSALERRSSAGFVSVRAPSSVPAQQ